MNVELLRGEDERNTRNCDGIFLIKKYCSSVFVGGGRSVWWGESLRVLYPQRILVSLLCYARNIFYLFIFNVHIHCCAILLWARARERIAALCFYECEISSSQRRFQNISGIYVRLVIVKIYKEISFSSKEHKKKTKDKVENKIW